mgnify:CR=1 FL=1
MEQVKQMAILTTGGSTQEKNITIYCFRGRMRSSAFTLLLMAYVVRVTGVLDGGYKGFRQWVLSAFPQPPPSAKMIRSQSHKIKRQKSGKGDKNMERAACMNGLRWEEEDDEIEESREEKSGNGDSPEIGATRPSQNNAWGFAANAQSKTCVISGLTGSGKTRVLAALAQRGERVIDLEGLANHCGSAFGWV